MIRYQWEGTMNYKQLGNTGTLVSKLCLGTMTFGGKGFWEAIGRMPQEEVTELIPLAESEGLALMPWSPLAGGFISGKYSRTTQKAGNSRRDEFDFPPVNKERAYDIIDVLAEIAKEHNASVARIALAWMLEKNL